MRNEEMPQYSGFAFLPISSLLISYKYNCCIKNLFSVSLALAILEGETLRPL
jgi:hypothetical protein